MVDYYQEGALLAADFNYNMMACVVITSKGLLTVRTIHADADTDAIRNGWDAVMKQRQLETPCIITGLPFSCPDVVLDPKRYHLPPMRRVFESITPQRIQRYPMVCLLAAIACHDLEGVQWSIRCGAAYTLLNSNNTFQSSPSVIAYLKKYDVELTPPCALLGRKLAIKPSADFLSSKPYMIRGDNLMCGNMPLRYMSLTLTRDELIVFLEKCNSKLRDGDITDVIIPALRSGTTITKCTVGTVMWALCLDVELVWSFTLVRKACSYYLREWVPHASIDSIIGPRCGASYKVDRVPWLPSINEIAYDPLTNPQMLPHYGE